ncbi:enoyl-CoA hydratase/isomerase family protein [Sphaerisporangium perillae]|uniref:enoyl-CoA hydratase/isomerase family protein n=1 Tax=Sphaerisporangium perillae TaxID=2935860 RepID=UPI00200BF930|nr:enoyl-CoA hydratase/isomerase family protein [Sphaerisporangium perillae]
MSNPPATEGLVVEQRGDVLEVTIDRGDENLLSMPMCETLTELLRRPPAGSRIMRLRANGPNFCLGRDRGERDPDALRHQANMLIELNQALQGGELVTVAEVTGGAAGFGVGLAALCDLSYASPSAQFWFPEVNAGWAPSVVLAWLPRMVGRSQAFRLTATGSRLDAEAAAGLGLITEVAKGDEDLSDLVESEIAALLPHDSRTHHEIRSFLRDTASASVDQAYRLGVERLTLGVLRRLGSAGS